MKLLSSILFISILAVSSAIGQNKVQLSIDQFVHYQGLEQASISFQVLDLETGKSVA